MSVPQQCMLLEYMHILCILTPLSEYLSAAVSDAQCVSFSRFVKIPQLPSGQDTQLLPSNPPSQTTSLSLFGLSPGLSLKDKDKQEDRHTHLQTHRPTHTNRLWHIHKNADSYRLLCKSRGSEGAKYLVLN